MVPTESICLLVYTLSNPNTHAQQLEFFFIVFLVGRFSKVNKWKQTLTFFSVCPFSFGKII